MKTITIGSVELPLNRFVVSGSAALGIKGTGKTVLAKGVVEQVMDHGVPVIIFDAIGVWRYLKTPGDRADAKGYKVVVAGGEAPDLPLTPANAAEIVRAAMRSGVSLVIDLYDAKLSKSDWRKIVQACFRTLLYENKPFGPRYVVLEEAAEYVPQKVYDNETYGEVEKFVRMGGNAQLGILLINQRSQEVNKSVLDLCDNLVLMRQRGSAAIDAVQKWLDKVNPEVADKVTASMPHMGKGHCWVWADDSDTPMLTKTTMPRSFHPDRTMAHQEIAKRKSVDTDEFVTKLRTDLVKVVEEAKSNNPLELRNEIARLNLQIRKLEKHPVIQAKEVTRDVPVFTKSDETKLRHVVEKLDEVKRMFERGVVKFPAIEELLKAISRPPVIVAPPRPVFTQQLSERRTVQPPQPRPTNGSDEITKGAREVLKTIVQFDGADDTQIAVLTGYKKTSRTTFKQQLHARGLIERRGDQYVATTEGVNILGNDYERLPAGDALREHWNKRLTGGELVCFQAFCSAYPADLSNEDLMTQTGYLKTSITTFKQRLAARRLIDGRRASANLFD